MGAHIKNDIHFLPARPDEPPGAGEATAGQGDPAAQEAAEVQEAARNPEAFSTLYSRYVKRVYHYCYGQTGNVQDAEDLTAQVFFEALRGLARYRSQGSFTAWLFTIAHRRAQNFHRRAPVWLPLETIEDIPGSLPPPLDQVIRRERLDALAHQLRQLKAEEIELLRLHYTARLTYPEIGQVLGRSETAVRMSVHRLLRRLRAAWEKTDEPSEE